LDRESDDYAGKSLTTDHELDARYHEGSPILIVAKTLDVGKVK